MTESAQGVPQTSLHGSKMPCEQASITLPHGVADLWPWECHVRHVEQERPACSQFGWLPVSGMCSLSGQPVGLGGADSKEACQKARHVLSWAKCPSNQHDWLFRRLPVGSRRVDRRHAFELYRAGPRVSECRTKFVKPSNPWGLHKGAP